MALHILYLCVFLFLPFAQAFRPHWLTLGSCEVHRDRRTTFAKTMLRLRGGEIKYPSSLEELDTILKDSSSKLVVIDFYSNDCPPCERVAPLYQELSESAEFQERVVFLKVNVEAQPTITTKYGVTGWPTFVFIKDGIVQTEIVGGKLAEATLYDWVQLLMPKDKK